MTNDDRQLPPTYFQRQDERADEEFYTTPRLVVHIDDNAIRALTALFAKLLPPQGTYLDLMSSWRSHLPDELEPQRVVGLGMNAAEMADNPQLDEHIVHNLNQNPTLPFATGAFDAVVCTVSVQYLTQPMIVFREVNRVVKPDGFFIVSFSNRCFPTKAVAAWLAGGDREHLGLVQQYFAASGNWGEPKAAANTPHNADPLYVVWAQKLPVSPDTA